MPQRLKPPRLWLRPPQRNQFGAVMRPAFYVILDNGKQISTGTADIATAEKALAAHMKGKRDLEQIPSDAVIDAAMNAFGATDAEVRGVLDEDAALRACWAAAINAAMRVERETRQQRRKTIYLDTETNTDVESNRRKTRLDTPRQPSAKNCRPGSPD